MQFQPKSEDQIKLENLLPKGEYDFEVLEAVDTKSKGGNEMIKVNLGIYQGEAIRTRIFDYLLSAMEAKLRHFCDATGLLAKYEAGTLCAEDCKGRAGRLKLVIKEDKTGQYPPKNNVADYMVRAAKPLAAPVAEKAPETVDDDVPFN